jgi:hypothetical protein
MQGMKTAAKKEGRKPKALFALNDPLLDDPQRVDEALEGFGSG